jgi:hypothetical protein
MKKSVLLLAVLLGTAAPACAASDSDWTVTGCTATTGAALSDGRVTLRATPNDLLIQVQARAWRFGGSVPISHMIGFDAETFDDGIPGMGFDGTAELRHDREQAAEWLEKLARSRRIWVKFILEDEVPWWATIRGNREAAEAMARCLR